MIDLIVAILNTDLALAALIAFVSAVVHGYTGFGGALVMVPLLAMLYGPVEAVAVATMVGLAGSVQLFPGAARNARWPEIRPMAVAIVVATPPGAMLLLSADPELVRRAIGGFVVLAAILMTSGWVYRGPRGATASAVTGALCGGMSGFAGVGGPPLVAYFMASPEPAAVQRANIVIAVAVVIAVLLVSLAIGGGIGAATIGRAVLLSPLYAAGTWAGSRLFDRAPRTFFRRAAMVLLIATGAAALLF